MSDNPVILWFRQDLRLADNPALQAAITCGRPILPLFVLDDISAGEWRTGGAGRWWLHYSLAALRDDLAMRGAGLLLSRGRADEVIGRLVADANACAVYWNRCYEPWAVSRDRDLKAALQRGGIEARSFNAALLCEPWQVSTKTGEPYKVFTPFWRAVSAEIDPPSPAPAPDRIGGLADMPAGDRLDDWALLPSGPDWAGGLRAAWTPGETGAGRCLEAFLDHGLDNYGGDRDRPDCDATSRLSPHLHWGELGPRQIWHAVAHLREAGTCPSARASVEKFLSEVGWREFSHHLLFHFPDLAQRNWRREFDRFGWREDDAALRAWQRGRTGYPLVDAGMRELWSTGWMHNRVRMVVASFLVKHLLVDWRAGAAWFWDTLVDADLANNSAGWQWVAGSGADAAPYFRIFNPVTQGEKFDPDAAYIRRWVPELADLPARYAHRPWEAPNDLDRAANVAPRHGYPPPIIEHRAARERALAAYQQLRSR